MLFNVFTIKNFQTFISFSYIYFFFELIKNKTLQNSFCDAAEAGQLDFQEAATPSMEGIINFNYNLTFLLLTLDNYDNPPI